MQTRQILVKALAAALAIFFIAYAIVEFRGLFLGPKINLFSPIDGSTVNNPILLMEGISERTKGLIINGNQTLIDLKGHFSVNLVLSPGYNIITIVATDSRGAKRTVVRHVYYDNGNASSTEMITEENASSTLETVSENETASSSAI